MGTEDKNNDVFFKRLFNEDAIEKAPDGFTDRVMQAIGVEEAELVQSRWSWSGWWLWGSIFLGVAALVTIVFFVDFSFMGSIFSGVELDGSRVANFVQFFGSGIVNAFQGFSISSTSIIIFMALGMLILAERIIRRRPKTQINLI
jgi:hypothetical protein